MEQSKQQRAAIIQNSIRQILLQNWDPLHINDNPKLIDVYDSYIAPIYRLLTKTRAENTVAELLRDIVEDQLGLRSSSEERLKVVAKLLVALT